MYIFGQSYGGNFMHIFELFRRIQLCFNRNMEGVLFCVFRILHESSKPLPSIKYCLVIGGGINLCPPGKS